MFRQMLKAVILCDAQEDMGNSTAFHLAGCIKLSSACGPTMRWQWPACSMIVIVSRAMLSMA